MDIRLLGPVELYAPRGPVPIGSAKQRALLAFLALQPQRLLTNDALIDGLWGQEHPDATVQALRFHVSRLRGILRQVDDADRLRTRPGGYQFVIADDAVDVLRFERGIAAARHARSQGSAPDVVSRAFREALDLWVGPALADINGEPFVAGERRRLDELRLAASEDYFAAELAAGHHSEAVAELERMVDRHPLRERFWELLMTALYRSGRQADALAAYQRVRRILADELGLEPSASLRELEHRILVQDTALARTEALPEHVSDANEKPVIVADVVPPHPGGDSRRRRGLATGALVLSVLALGLFFWFGAVSAVIAVLAACGAIAARRATAAGRSVDGRAILAIVVSVVALTSGIGLTLYRRVTSEGETAASVAVSDDSEREPRTQGTNDSSMNDELAGLAELRVGDCFEIFAGPQPPMRGAGLSQVLSSGYQVPCEEPHDQELYHLFELAIGPYPGDEQVQAQAIERCSTQFLNYVGVAPDESALDVFYVYPDSAVWQQGIRGGGCTLYDKAGLDLTGSMAGSRR
jgi:DNA-binding SARP family transcriptional activator